ncbi:predicted protein [Streptomyces iranensis]|uniref:Uncharacterized protein n=1 Tax=Streptomyces iranensis TaxID=576784 RepID=A0A060ZLJ4_9ACTN|nr:predicted protein [Streptomyces iranensis]
MRGAGSPDAVHRMPGRHQQKVLGQEILAAWPIRELAADRPGRGVLRPPPSVAEDLVDVRNGRQERNKNILRAVMTEETVHERRGGLLPEEPHRDRHGLKYVIGRPIHGEVLERPEAEGDGPRGEVEVGAVA